MKAYVRAKDREMKKMYFILSASLSRLVRKVYGKQLHGFSWHGLAHANFSRTMFLEGIWQAMSFVHQS